MNSSRGAPYHHGNLRQALVAAAVELARQGGPAAIVLREAARRVGVSPNAAYRHFTALPDLIEAVAEDALNSLAESMKTELARWAASDGPLARLNAVGRGYINFALDQPGLFAVAFSKRHHGIAEGMPLTGTSSPSDLLEEALDGMVAAGVLAPGDRDAAAVTAWSAVHGLAQLLLGPLAELPASDREDLIQAHLDLVGRGLVIR